MQMIKSFFGVIILAAIAALVYVGLNNSRMLSQGPEVLRDLQKPFESETRRETASAEGNAEQEISGVDPADLQPPQVELDSPPPTVAPADIPHADTFSGENARALVPVNHPDDSSGPPAMLMEQPEGGSTPKESRLLPSENAQAGAMRLPDSGVIQTSAVAAQPEDIVPPEIHQLLREGKLSEALLELTRRRYGPGAPMADSPRVDTLLNQLAGSVVYSEKSYAEPPYQVQASDTWDNLAGRFGTTPTFLAKVNRLNPAEPLPVGRALKVVRGPFDAMISLRRHELILILDDRYAGRFPIAVGDAAQGLSGSFIVQSKTHTPTYHDGSRAYPPGDPTNPLGDCLINPRSGDRVARYEFA